MAEEYAKKQQEPVCKCADPDIGLRVQLIDQAPTITKEQLDAVYAERNMCVALIAQLAKHSGMNCGMGIDAREEPGWQHMFFLDLPGSGQVSWHIPDSAWENFPTLPLYEKVWDGHTTPEKYERVKVFASKSWSGLIHQAQGRAGDKINGVPVSILNKIDQAEASSSPAMEEG